MSDLTGITEPSKTLRKDVLYVDVPAEPIFNPALQESLPVQPVFSQPPAVFGSGGSNNSGYLLQGADAAGQAVLVYIPPNTTISTVNVL